MIAYTAWDFLLQSVLIVFIGLLFWGIVAFLVLLAIIGIDTLRERRRAAHRPKIVQFADWHKPGDLEDA